MIPPTTLELLDVVSQLPDSSTLYRLQRDNRDHEYDWLYQRIYELALAFDDWMTATGRHELVKFLRDTDPDPYNAVDVTNPTDIVNVIKGARP